MADLAREHGVLRSAQANSCQSRLVLNHIEPRVPRCLVLGGDLPERRFWTARTGYSAEVDAAGSSMATEREGKNRLTFSKTCLFLNITTSLQELGFH